MNQCPIQSECGGCPQMVATSDAQRERHTAHVERLLHLPVLDYHESPRRLGYRARIDLTRGPSGQLGYRAHRSHVSIPVSNCPIARPEINVVLEQIGEVPRAVERVSLRSDGTRVVVHAQCKDKNRGRVKAWISTLEHIDADLAVNGRGVHGDPTTHLKVSGISHRLSPSTFYQVNLEVNERLVADVVDHVVSRAPSAVLDLFSGAGNLSMPLAARGLKTTMIEAHPTATKDARRTAVDHALEPDIRSGRAEDFQAGDAFFDVAILDPPRKGAGAVIDQVLLTRPKAVVMVSCNTRALASDLRRAEKQGYRMNGVSLYEMFPHTDHIEAVGVLSST